MRLVFLELFWSPIRHRISRRKSWIKVANIFDTSIKAFKAFKAISDGTWFGKLFRGSEVRQRASHGLGCFANHNVAIVLEYTK